MSGDDLYLILGVPAAATADEIKAAYRRLVRTLHPDARGEGDRAAFQRVQDAYEVLGDPHSRRAYDRSRITASAGGPMPGRPEPHRRRPTGVHRGPGRVRTPEGAAADAADAGPASGDLAVELVMTPAEARVGGPVGLWLKMDLLCPACGGLGENLLSGVCPHCGGAGRLWREREVAVDLPAPVIDGTVMEIPLDGHGRPRSRLLLRLRVE